MKNKKVNHAEQEVLVKVTSAFKVDPKRPRPKWWDNHIGEDFWCYDYGDHVGWDNLSPRGLEKMKSLGYSGIAALIYKSCGEDVSTPKKEESVFRTLTKFQS